MQLDRRTLYQLLAETLTAPRSAAQKILSIRGGYALALIAVGALACISALISVLPNLSVPASGNPMMDNLIARPLLLAAIQAGGMALFAGIITGVGRLFGGTGRLVQALLMLAWVDFFLLVAQLALLVIVLILPFLAGPLVLFIMVVSAWVMSSFIAALHGFEKTLPTLGVLVTGILLIGILMLPYAPQS